MIDPYDGDTVHGGRWQRQWKLTEKGFYSVTWFRCNVTTVEITLPFFNKEKNGIQGEEGWFSVYHIKIFDDKKINGRRRVRFSLVNHPCKNFTPHLPFMELPVKINMFHHRSRTISFSSNPISSQFNKTFHYPFQRNDHQSYRKTPLLNTPSWLNRW